MTDMDKELIEEKLKLIYLTIESNHKETLLTQKHILEQVLKTNGRVTTLEKETSLITTLTKNPKMVILTALGLIALTNLNEIGPMLQAIINIFN